MIRRALAVVPDGKLLKSLRTARGRGRNDYPVETLWGTALLTVALRHPTFEACVAELNRNRGLRELIGIESEGGVPKKWNLSRFLDVLGTEPHLSLLREVFDGMAQRLAAVVDDLGRHTAGDGDGQTLAGPQHPHSTPHTDKTAPPCTAPRSIACPARQRTAHTATGSKFEDWSALAGRYAFSRPMWALFERTRLVHVFFLVRLGIQWSCWAGWVGCRRVCYAGTLEKDF